MINAVKKVGVHEFINELPNGYDFEVKEKVDYYLQVKGKLLHFKGLYKPQLLF